MSNLPVTNIKPGELHVNDSPSRIKTLLGSCVSVALCNTQHGFGGMNHFMLPESIPSRSRGERDFRFGDVSTRFLIEKMLEFDSDRDNIDAKLFGGGRVVQALEHAEIGKSNIESATNVLAEYGIRPSKKQVNTDHGLKLDFNTLNNRVKVEPIKKSNERTGDAQSQESEEKLKRNESRVEEILSGGEGLDGIDFLSDEPD